MARLVDLAPASPPNLLLEIRLATGDDILREARKLTESHPDFGPGWRFRAINEVSGTEAGAAMLHYLDLEPKPAPGDFMTCAGWLAGAGESARAIDVLDLGLAKLGVLTGLHEMAMGIEIDGDLDEAALRRVDALAARYRPS